MAALVLVLCAGTGVARFFAVLVWAAPGGNGGVQAVIGGVLAGSVVYQEAAGRSQTLGVLSGRLALRLEPASSITRFGSGPGGGFRQAPAWWAAVTVEPWLPVELWGDGLLLEGSAAVAEAYTGFRFPAADVYVGRFPLPLETARLVVPYTLTPLDDAGRRLGVDGARADVYLNSGRLQLAAARVKDQWTLVAGWRRAFSGWETAGYVIAGEHGVDAGIGASGLVESIVLYGEAWSVAGEDGLRGSVGATGYLGDAIWTAELARTSFPTTIAPGPASTPVLLVSAQLAYAPATGWMIAADAAVALEDLRLSQNLAGAGSESEWAHQVGVTVTHELVPGEAELELAVRRRALPRRSAASAAGATAATAATASLRWFS